MADEERIDSSDISHYDSSGIDERHGVIPGWLVVVYVALAIWMVYYLVQFWTDKG